jgi:hypothetical protein
MENDSGDSSSEILKVGQVVPGERHEEIIYTSPDGTTERFTGIITDETDPDAVLATRYSLNVETGEAEAQHGRIIGTVREGGNFVWEHKKGAVVTLASIAVAVGSLIIRYRHKHK